MNRLDTIESAQLRTNIPDFKPGDTVRVHVRIKESETKERLHKATEFYAAYGRKIGSAKKLICSRCVSRLVSLTVAPPITPPEESLTVP